MVAPTLQPWLAIGAVSLTLCGLLGLLRYWQLRWQPDPEWVRKGLHVGAGLLALGLPDWFDAPWQVLVLALAWLGWFAALRRIAWLGRLFGPLLSGVGRQSHGEFAFIFAVLLLFVFAQDARVHYTCALLVLTFADSAAALVGRRWGRVGWPFAAGKSVEGSLAFFASACLLTWLPLHGAAGAEADSILLVSINVALLATIAEAVSSRGLDNLLVPVLVFVLLQLLPGLPPAWLQVLVTGVIGLLAIAALPAPIAHLSTDPPR